MLVRRKTTPIEKLSRPFLRFFEIEAAGGMVLLICTVIALWLANSPWAENYIEFWHIPISLSIGEWKIDHSLGHWINDGLMTIFFFVVGLEIKREMVSGELKEMKAAMLPILAALGGMVVPAVLYTVGIRGNPGSAGWGIPMATDIAFVVGFLSLFGKRVPHGLKIFILSLAIVDDLGAILVIALFYSTDISLVALAFGGLGLLTVKALNHLGVRRVPVYFVVGVLVWFAFLASGIHPTIAGVLLGLLTPASAWVGDRAFLDVLGDLPRRWKTTNGSDIKKLISTARETVPPLERLELALHPWVAFFIMPLFALANAGVPLELSALGSPVSLAVALGLVAGKPIGIVLFSWLAIRFLGARLPQKVTWGAMAGVGMLGGIGFTMSLFIGTLALSGDLLVDGKVGTFLGSTLSVIFGMAVLSVTLPKKKIS